MRARVRCLYLAKVNLVEYDLIWMADASESCEKGQQRYYANRNLVVPVF